MSNSIRLAKDSSWGKSFSMSFASEMRENGKLCEFMQQIRVPILRVHLKVTPGSHQRLCTPTNWIALFFLMHATKSILKMKCILHKIVCVLWGTRVTRHACNLLWCPTPKWTYRKVMDAKVRSKTATVDFHDTDVRWCMRTMNNLEIELMRE